MGRYWSAVITLIIYSLIEVAALVDGWTSRFDDIQDAINILTVHKYHWLLIFVQDKPQHKRQKYVSQATEESKCNPNSSFLSYVPVEGKKGLRKGVSESDANMAGSNERIHLNLLFYCVCVHLHFSVELQHQIHHQPKYHTRNYIYYWPKHCNSWK